MIKPHGISASLSTHFSGRVISDSFPFYAGLRLGEVVALDLDDIHLSARKGLITVRVGKGSRYREIPVHLTLRADLALRINDERPNWPGATTVTVQVLAPRVVIG